MKEIKIKITGENEKQIHEGIIHYFKENIWKSGIDLDDFLKTNHNIEVSIFDITVDGSIVRIKN